MCEMEETCQAEGPEEQARRAHAIQHLPKKKQRGSAPRCLLLTEGSDACVSRRLTRLVDLPDVEVRGPWMPKGLPRLGPNGWDLSPIEEAELGRTPVFLTEGQRTDLLGWWLAVHRRARVPNWDIAANGLIGSKPGLLLVEAKAHDSELHRAGKEDATTANGWANHARIGQAIGDASAALSQLTPGFHLSRDHHYQLSNRFAWAWKVAALGVPVVLMYLGFLNANEMRDRGEPLTDNDHWERAVKLHAEGIVPQAVWGQRLMVGEVPLLVLIRSTRVDLP